MNCGCKYRVANSTDKYSTPPHQADAAAYAIPVGRQHTPE